MCEKVESRDKLVTYLGITRYSVYLYVTRTLAPTVRLANRKR